MKRGSAVGPFWYKDYGEQAITSCVEGQDLDQYSAVFRCNKIVNEKLISCVFTMAFIGTIHYRKVTAFLLYAL